MWRVPAMTQSPFSAQAQPRIDELMARFLNQQAADRAAGIPEPTVSEIEPYEAAFAPAVEPRTALDEAVTALKLCAPDGGLANVAMPPDGPSLVTNAGPHFAAPLAAGGFPQLLRDLPGLLRAEKKAALLAEGTPVNVPSLIRWTNLAAEKGRLPDALV